MSELIVPDANVILRFLALELYSSENLDFVDNILIALKQLHSMDIRTFDKKLRRYLARAWA